MATDRTVAIYPSGATSPGGYAATFTTMAAMESAEDGDLIAADTRLIVEITASDGSWATADTANVLFDGWDCDYSSGQYIWMYTLDDGARSSDGNWDTGAYRLEETAGQRSLVIDNDGSGAVGFSLIMEYVQVGKVTTSTTNVRIKLANSADHGTIEFNQCYFRRTVGSGGHFNFRVDHTDTTNFKLYCRNCVFDDTASGTSDTTVYMNGADWNECFFVNCTIVGTANSNGLRADANTNFEAINCAIFAHDNDLFQMTGIVVNYCATDDEDGTNTRDMSPGGDESADHHAAVTDPDGTPPDFTVKDTNSVLYRDGLDQTSEPQVPAIDIAGVTRPAGSNPVSIGAFEFVASGIDYDFIAAILADTLTTAPSMPVSRVVTAATIADSLTTTVDFNVLRECLAAVIADSSVTTIDFDVLRALSSAILSDSLTTDIDIFSARNFITSIIAESETSNIALSVVRDFISAITFDSNTSSISLTALQDIVAAIAGDSSTTAVALDNLVQFNADIKGDSETTQISLAVVRELLAAIASETNTTNITLNVLRIIIAAIEGDTSTTAITLAVITLIEFIASAEGESATTQIAINAVRDFLAASIGESSTTGIDLALLREFVAAVIAESDTTAITLTVTGLIEFIAAIEAESDTTSIALNMARNFLAAMIGDSATTSIDLVMLREFVAAVISESDTTSIDVPMLRDLAAVVISESDTTSIDITTLREIIAAVIGESDTTVMSLSNLRRFAAAILGDSDTTALSLSNLNQFTAAILGDSDTTSIDITTLRAVAAAIIADSETSDIDLETGGYGDTYYIDETNGNDGDNGLSAGNAWQSTNKINNFAESPGFGDGDSILFKRGETWGAGYETVGNDGSGINWGGVDDLTFGAYGSGDLPTFDANDHRPFYISATGSVGWTLKNLRGYGMDGWGSLGQGMFHLKDLTDLTLDNIYADAHVGTSSYTKHEKMIYLSDFSGDLEVKNCTFKNNYNLNDWGAWGTTDCHLMFLNQSVPLTTGSIKIHDNVFSGCYADSIQWWLIECTGWTEIYNNTFEKYGENCLDSKSDAYIKIYGNTFDRSWTKDKGNSNLSQVIFHKRAGYITPHDIFVYENLFIGGGDDQGVSMEAQDDIEVYANYFTNHELSINCYAGTNIDVYNNVIYSPDTAGTRLIQMYGRSGMTGLRVFNNTLYSNKATVGIEADAKNAKLPAGTVIEGNIVYVDGAGKYPIKHETDQGAPNFTPHYNVCYNPSGGDIYWDGAPRGDGWEDNIVADPLFNNISLGELWVGSGSPAIGAHDGTNVATNGVHPTTTWPSNVITTVRDDADIGAYELSTVLNFIAAIIGDSNTSAINLDHTGLVEFIVAIIGDSLTASANAAIERSITSATVAETVSTSITVTRLMDFLVAAVGESLTSNMNMAIEGILEFAALITGESLSTDMSIAMARVLAASISGDSLTTTTVLSVLRQFSASINAESLSAAITFIADSLGEIFDPSIVWLVIEKALRSQTASKTIISATPVKSILEIEPEQ